MKLWDGNSQVQGLCVYVKDGQFAGICDRDGNKIEGISEFIIDGEALGVAEVTLKATLMTRRDKAGE